MTTKLKERLLLCALVFGMITFAACKDDNDDSKKTDDSKTGDKTEMVLPTFQELNAYSGKTNTACQEAMEAMDFKYYTSMQDDGISMAFFIKTQSSDTTGYVFASYLNKVIGAYYFTSTSDKQSAMKYAPSLSAQAMVWMGAVQLDNEEYEGTIIANNKEYEAKDHQDYLAMIDKFGVNNLQFATEMIFALGDMKNAGSGVVPGSFDSIVEGIFGDDEDDEEQPDIAALVNTPKVYIMLGCVDASSAMGAKIPLKRINKRYNVVL